VHVEIAGGEHDEANQLQRGAPRQHTADRFQGDGSGEVDRVADDSIPVERKRCSSNLM